MGVKTGGNLAKEKIVAVTDQDFIQTVLGCDIAYRLAKENKQNPDCWLDAKMITLLRKRYTGLSRNELIVLFIDVYHTNESKKMPGEKHKVTMATIITENKLIAIGVELCKFLETKKKG